MRNTVLFFLIVISSFSLQAQSADSKHHKKDYYVFADTGFLDIKPERGATLKGFYLKDSLNRIELWYGFNFGDLRRTFYYWNNKLIMVTEIQRLYNNSASNVVNADSVKPNYEGRYLFEKDSLTSVKQEGHFSFMDTPADKVSMQNTFLTMSADYSQLADRLKKSKKNRIKMK